MRPLPVIFLGVLVCAPACLHVTGAAGADLRVSLSGFSSSRGVARVSLYNSEKGFPDEPRYAFRTASVPITDRHAECTFINLPPGEYAISAYHDENGNHALDRNIAGLPREAAGASLYTERLRGKPVFPKAVFRVDEPSRAIAVILFSPPG